MHETVVINLDKPLKSATLVNDHTERPSSTGSQDIAADNGQDNCGGVVGTAPQWNPAAICGPENHKAQLDRLCQTLDKLVNDLNRCYEQAIAQHAEEIARLSVEIARKILMQKVQRKDYEIETIVKEALKNSPTHNDIVVHLNPDDIVQCQKLQQADADIAFAGIRFVADPKIECAQCLVETPKGIVKSFIEEHLARIEEALTKVR